MDSIVINVVVFIVAFGVCYLVGSWYLFRKFKKDLEKLK